jgi:hypothetical protein
MDWKRFLKPTKRTILFFLLFAILSLSFFGMTDAKIFACKTRPVIPNPPEFSDSFCGLGIFIFYIGAEMIFTPMGYITIILVLFALPYFLSCGINSLIKKK